MTAKEHIDYRAGCLLLVDKPLEWTSFDVVNKIKHKLNYKIPKGSRIKVGHAGTLDPLATGLLIHRPVLGFNILPGRHCFLIDFLATGLALALTDFLVFSVF